MKFQTDKEKGQHILVNSDIVKEEVSLAEISKEDRVVEIGAGPGNLTKELAERAKEVLAFEPDKKFEKELEEIRREKDNIRIIYDKATNYSWNNYNKTVSNIPYFLSDQVISKLVQEEEKEIEKAVFIVGEKFKNNLISTNKKSAVLVSLFYDIEPIRKIGKEEFSPHPSTDSWIIKLTKKPEKSGDKSEVILKDVVKQRKKKIKNAIISSLVSEGKTKNQAREIISNLNIYKNVLDKPVSRITGNLILRLKENLKEAFTTQEK